MFKKLFKLSTALEIAEAYLEIKNVIKDSDEIIDKTKSDVDNIIKSIKNIQSNVPELRKSTNTINNIIKKLFKKC